MALERKDKFRACANVVGNPFAITSSKGLLVASCSRISAGVYLLWFEADSDIAVDLAQVMPIGNTALIATVTNAGGLVQVKLFDAAGVAADGSFYFTMFRG